MLALVMRGLTAPLRFCVWIVKLLWGFSNWTKPLAIIVIALLPLAIYVPPDALTRVFMSDTPTISAYGGADNRKAVIGYGGAGAKPGKQFSELISTFREQGHTFVVETAEAEFSAPESINAALAAVPPEKYDMILLVGASKGGLLSNDTVKEMRKRGDTRPVGIVMIDSPFQGSDVVGIPPLLGTASIIPLGAITNLWFHPPFEEGDISQMSPDVNRQELFGLWDSYKTWKASCWGDEGQYVFYHDWFYGPVEQHSGVKWAFVRSMGDTFVDGKAAWTNWRSAVGPVELFEVPKAGHISFHDWPREYATQIGNGLKYVSQVG